MEESHKEIIGMLKQIKERVDSIEQELLELRDDFDDVFFEEEEEQPN